MSKDVSPQYIKNSHLDGDSFAIPGGNIGILLIHGLTATTAEVRLLAEGLAEEDYSISAPLLPGHGTNPHDANLYHWKDWLRVCSHALETLRDTCDYLFVGGESTGALLALLLAHKNPDIAGVLVYAPALKLTLPPIKRLIIRAASPFIPYFHKEVIDDGLPWKGYTVSPLRSVVQLFNMQSRVVRVLPSITQPILVIQGEKDSTVHHDTPAFIKDNALLSCVEVHWMKNSSHVVAIDIEHQEVISITKEFIKRQLRI